MTSADVASSASGRDGSIDATRGIAIVAVVFFHVTRGLISAGKMPQTYASELADAIAYGFHIQTFLLIAGWFAFDKAANLRFQIHHQLSLYYCYLIWSLLSWILSNAASAHVNHPVDFHDLIFLPIIPIEQFWFILVLMVGTALLGILRTPERLLLGVAVLVAITYIEPWNRLGIYQSLVFVLIGGALRAVGARIAVDRAAGVVAFLCLLAGARAVVAAGRIYFDLMLLPAMLSGCYAAFVAGSLLAPLGRLGQWLQLLGRKSLVIYLVHAISGAGARILLYAVAPGAGTLIAILICTLAGLLGPLAFDWFAARMGVGALVGLKPLPFGQPKRILAPVTQ